jgi:hypothetical protein
VAVAPGEFDETLCCAGLLKGEGGLLPEALRGSYLSLGGVFCNSKGGYEEGKDKKSAGILARPGILELGMLVRNGE